MAVPPIEEFDLTILGAGAHYDANVVARPVIVSEGLLCASATYLRHAGVPRQPEDLQQHACLRLRQTGARQHTWRLINPQEADREASVEVAPALVANHTDTLLRAMLDGAGISAQPLDLVANYLRDGHLKRVLAPWITGRFTLYAALPSRKYVPARARAFMEFLIEQTRLKAAQAEQTWPAESGDRRHDIGGCAVATAVWRAAASAAVDRAGEVVLPPGLEHRHRHGIRQVQAALAGLHGQPQALSRGERCAQCRRQAPCFRAEHEPVAGRESDVIGAARAVRRQREHARGRRRLRGQKIAPSRRAAHLGVLVVVQPRAPQELVVHRKPQRLDQMQGAAGVGRQPDDVAGVGRNFGLDQDEVITCGDEYVSRQGRPGLAGPRERRAGSTRSDKRTISL